MRGPRLPGYLTSRESPTPPLPPTLRTPPGHWRLLVRLPPRLRMRLVSSKMPGMRQCALRPRPALPNRLFSGGSPGNPGQHPHPGPYSVPAPSLPGPLAAPPQVQAPQQATCAGAANSGCLRGAPGSCGNCPPGSGSGKTEPCVHAALRPRSSVSSRASQHFTRLQTWKLLPAFFRARSPFQSA